MEILHRMPAGLDKSEPKGNLDRCQWCGVPLEVLANARLIAAAPDMYEALRELLPMFESGYIANDSVRAEKMRLKFEASIKKALTKAEGK